MAVVGSGRWDLDDGSRKCMRCVRWEVEEFWLAGL